MKDRAVAALLAAAVVGAAPAANAAGASLAVSVDRTAVTTKLGHTFVIRSTITNRSSAVAVRLIAHLNVLSLGRGLYVDPEDWSSRRTRYLPPIPAGGSTTLSWKLVAVNGGDLGVYIAVLPQSGRAVEPTTGPLVHVTIADRRALDAGGILPLALGLPALLALAMAFSRFARRGKSARHSRV
jgi:hypothetical protein